MAMPKSVVKSTKNGFEFTDNVDRVQYTMKELIRGALRDCGKYICRETRREVKRRTGKLAKNIQYWVRSRQPTPNLQVGMKPSGFYGGFQELGTSKQKKIGALESAVKDNIPMVIQIQSKYLSALESEAKALAFLATISEKDIGDDDE